MRSRKALFTLGGALAVLGCSGGADDYGPVTEDEHIPRGPVPDRAQWEKDHPELATPTGESQKSCATRNDFAHLMNLHAGIWGNWAPCIDFCPPDSFAYGVNVKSEAPQGGSADDTAANAISLHCFNRYSGVFTDFVESSQGPWGGWFPTTYCPNGMSNPLNGGQLLTEAPQGSGDDTVVNRIAVSCKQFSGFPYDVQANTSWGAWTGLVNCPTGTQVCGIKTRVLGSQGSGVDDSALNGVDFACCNY
jgi:hypothetical protein